MMEDDRGEPLDVTEIGRRLKHTRSTRHLSLDSVAKSSGISSSLLSQVERGKVTPSLSTLHALSQVLSIPMFELFGTPADQVAVTRAGSRTTIRPPESGDVSYERLSSGSLQSLQMIEMHVGAVAGSFDHTLSHAGEECVLVLEGRATIEIADQQFELNVGDSISYLSRQPHRFSTAGKRHSRLIVAMTPPAF